VFRVPRNGIRCPPCPPNVAATLPLASIAHGGRVSVAMRDDGAVKGLYSRPKRLAWPHGRFAERDREIPSPVGVNEMWYVAEKKVYTLFPR